MDCDNIEGANTSRFVCCQALTCDRCSMPTVLVVDGFRFFFFSNEGFEPPHIHVEKGDGHAKWWLGESPELAYSEGFTPSQLRRLRELVVEHRDLFAGTWNEYFHRS